MSKIKFIESTHQYLADNEELISVSAFTKLFQKQEDWKAIATRKAKKMTNEGVPTTAKELLAKWERKRNTSADIGSLYHAIREEELLAKTMPVFYDTPCQKQACTYEKGDKFSIPINDLANNTVYPELMIYDTDFMICGQADKVIVTGNKIHVWDYKTDAEMKFKGYSNQWKSATKLLPPLSHLDDCNGNIYSIKMSLYMYLLWKANKGRFRVGDLMIEHIHLLRDPANDGIAMLKDGKPIVTKIEQIPLPYRRDEVEKMLATIKPK